MLYLHKLWVMKTSLMRCLEVWLLDIEHSPLLLLVFLPSMFGPGVSVTSNMVRKTLLSICKYKTHGLRMHIGYPMYASMFTLVDPKYLVIPSWSVVVLCGVTRCCSLHPFWFHIQFWLCWSLGIVIGIVIICGLCLCCGCIVLLLMFEALTVVCIPSSFLRKKGVV